MNAIMNKLFHLLIVLRKYPFVGFFAFYTLRLFGIYLPREAKVGKNLQLKHWAPGTVIHPRTTIEDNVKIYQNVTCGRSDVNINVAKSKFVGIVIKKGAILGAGAVVLCKEGTLVVGENTLIGANAVLLNSTGDNEVWVGNPARKVS